MFIARTKQEIINFIASARQGKTAKIAFVPTMGALHEGHLSLIKLAKQQADIVICSIFVNPTQFGPNEDFNKYPRTLEDDCKLLAETKCNVVFAPDIAEIYGDGSFDSKPQNIKNADIMCGAFRPGHFAGVVQIVGKLFDVVKPDIAIFGEKDFQQLWILKDTFRNINIVGAPIVREADGLAMSSRNRYLAADERKIAGALNVVLKNTLEQIKNGADIQNTLEKAKIDLLSGYSETRLCEISSRNARTESSSLHLVNENLSTDMTTKLSAEVDFMGTHSRGFTKIDYLEIREEDNLKLTKALSDRSRIFAAIWLGKTRLIDNLPAR